MDKKTRLRVPESFEATEQCLKQTHRGGFALPKTRYKSCMGMFFLRFPSLDWYLVAPGSQLQGVCMLIILKTNAEHRKYVRTATYEKMFLLKEIMVSAGIP